MIEIKNKNSIHRLVLILAIAGWSFIYIFVKQAKDVAPINIAFARYAIGLFLFLPFFIKKVKKIEKIDLPPLIIISTIVGAVVTMMMVWSTKLSLANNVSVIINSNPIFIILLAPILIKEKTNLKAKIGGILGFVGIYLAVFQGFHISSLMKSEYLLGNVIALVCALTVAFVTIYHKKYIDKYGALTTTFWTLACSFIFLLTLSLLTGDLLNFKINNSNIWPLLGIGSISTLFPFIGFFYGIKKLGASAAAMHKMLIPILTAIFAWLFLSEQITNYTLIGMCFTIIGIYLVNSKNKKYVRR